MDDKAVVPFDRLIVVIAGYELTARPIAFIYDNLNNPVDATLFETTCPECGNLIQFTRNDVININNEMHVNCVKCDYGAVKNRKKDTIIIKTGTFGQQLVSEKIKVDDVCPFQDPIELGIFDQYKI